MDLLKTLFGSSRGDGSGTGSDGQSRDLRVAACALFLEMAQADGEFDASERDRIVGLIKREYGLSEETASALMRRASQEVEASIDYWQFTHLINSRYSLEEKIQLIEMMWKIAFADGKLDKHEDYLVHKLAELLNLDHKQLIDAKLRMKAKGVQ